jgi:hypothetical protein
MHAGAVIKKGDVAGDIFTLMPIELDNLHSAYFDTFYQLWLTSH